ncbi:MAG: response regulator [Acidimicrobiia bacterium]|nr:response regulator [Acidimicrobiia bacterium]
MSEGRPASPLTVLIADDDADQRLILRMALTAAGASTVVEASNANDAIRAARFQRFDLVVLDVTMPGRTGIDALPEMQDALAGAPIVMFSSHPRSSLADTALRAGAVGYIEKRVPPSQLAHEIFLAAALVDHAAGEVSKSLPADLHAAGAARRFIREHLSDRDDEVVAAVELLVSELVTNAVVHASSAPRVDIRIAPDAARVEVHDDDPTLPEMRTPSPEATGGRGLLLLDRIATRWGSEIRHSGKIVWFELARTP